MKKDWESPGKPQKQHVGSRRLWQAGAFTVLCLSQLALPSALSRVPPLPADLLEEIYTNVP